LFFAVNTNVLSKISIKTNFAYLLIFDDEFEWWFLSSHEPADIVLHGGNGCLLIATNLAV